MTKTRTATKHPRRSAAWRLDPYGVEGTTITLEEWRRINGTPARRSARPRTRTDPPYRERAPGTR